MNNKAIISREYLSFAFLYSNFIYMYIQSQIYYGCISPGPFNTTSIRLVYLYNDRHPVMMIGPASTGIKRPACLYSHDHMKSLIISNIKVYLMRSSIDLSIDLSICPSLSSAPPVLSHFLVYIHTHLLYTYSYCPID